MTRQEIYQGSALDTLEAEVERLRAEREAHPVRLTAEEADLFDEAKPLSDSLYAMSMSGRLRRKDASEAGAAALVLGALARLLTPEQP
jgi:hypothetical protein